MATRLGTRKYLAERMRQGAGVIVRAKDDSKTCAYCRAQNGKFVNGDRGNKPPYHPNCRCGE
jgi:hypothetical protein